MSARNSSAGRMDLLSALSHEVGHLLGRDHTEGGAMAETLAPSVRLALPATSRRAVRSRVGAMAAEPPSRMSLLRESPRN